MTGRFIEIDGIATHYLEAGTEHKGRKPSVLLLHSAEYGGAAEISWEYNLEAIGAHHHVLAPDHLGFGRTDKMFDFCGQFDRRIRHIRRFLEEMAVGPVHVVSSSMSGGMSLVVAARPRPDWPMVSLTVCSGGGISPRNAAREVLNSFDGTFEHMRRIVEVMFADPRWAADEAYVTRRWRMATMPGAWEATSAARFRAPFNAPAGHRERDAIDYGLISVPTLIMAGRRDPLREPGYTDAFVPLIPDARLHVFEEAAHMGNIEASGEFNASTLEFLETVGKRTGSDTRAG